MPHSEGRISLPKGPKRTAITAVEMHVSPTFAHPGSPARGHKRQPRPRAGEALLHRHMQEGWGLERKGQLQDKELTLLFP